VVDHLAFSQFLVDALALEELLRHIPAVVLGAADGNTSVIQKIIPTDTPFYLQSEFLIRSSIVWSDVRRA
jgi:hypothetical protein